LQHLLMERANLIISINSYLLNNPQLYGSP
jgi:hypothetical protein